MAKYLATLSRVRDAKKVAETTLTFETILLDPILAARDVVPDGKIKEK